MAILVLDHGRVVHARGYGLADVETGRPIDDATPFQLASVSKQMTAMAIMILAEQGVLAYDDPVARFLPEVAAHPARRALTIRHLLHNTSGIPDYLFHAELPEGREEGQMGNSDVVAWVAAHRPHDFPPGTRYAYSNTNYVLLAAIVARASRRSFGDFMQERVFRPLGMPTAVAFDHPGLVIPDRARGYDRGMLGGFARDGVDSAIVGDGCIYASLRDFVGWETALSSSRLVSLRTLDQAFTPGRLSDGTSTGYGYGWEIETTEGHRVVSHDGAWEGCRTAIVRLPDERITVVVLANRADIDAPDVAAEVARIQLSHRQPTAPRRRNRSR